jgi:hypothetical protein
MSTMLETHAHDGEAPRGEDARRLHSAARIDGHLANLDRMVRLTALADTKAAPLVAAHATIAAVSITQVHNLADLVRDGNVAQVTAVWILAAIYVAFAAVSLVLSVRVFLPTDKPGKRSVLYFADVARMSLEEFMSRSIDVTSSDLEHDALQQTHTVAVVVANKFRRVRLAFGMMLIAIVAWLGLIALANV